MDPFSSALRATCTAAVAMLAWVGRRLCAGLVGHCWAAFATERWNRCGSDRGGPIYKNRGFHSPRRLSFHYSCRSNSGAESSREDAPRTLHVLRNCLLVALTPPVKTAEDERVMRCVDLINKLLKCSTTCAPSHRQLHPALVSPPPLQWHRTFSP